MVDQWLCDFVVHALQVAVGAGLGIFVGLLFVRPAPGGPNKRRARRGP